jgi:hypothetical protein
MVYFGNERSADRGNNGSGSTNSTEKRMFTKLETFCHLRYFKNIIKRLRGVLTDDVAYAVSVGGMKV